MWVCLNIYHLHLCLYKSFSGLRLRRFKLIKKIILYYFEINIPHKHKSVGIYDAICGCWGSNLNFSRIHYLIKIIKINIKLCIWYWNIFIKKVYILRFSSVKYYFLSITKCKYNHIKYLKHFCQKKS